MWSLPRWCVVLIFVGSGAMAADSSAPAYAEATDGAVSAGRERFVDACAFCHGLSGTGNGMAASMLEQQPADLTQLSKNNAGRFPLASIYSIIDGRMSTAAHGARDMPVWGNIWKKNVPEQYAEYYVRGRILELILYLDSIQEQ